MSIYEVASRILYEVRKANGWSMEQMAGKCELSDREYGDLERGKRLPNLITMVRISKIHDLDLNILKEADFNSLSARKAPA